jgi:flagellar protein FliS
MHRPTLADATQAYGQLGRRGADAGSVVLLYDGAIRHIAQARAAIAEAAVERRWQHVARATAIVDGLQQCLDHARGGEIAGMLDRLYTYVALRLQDINLRNDPRACDELVGLLRTLRASWAELAERGAGAAPSPRGGAVAA